MAGLGVGCVVTSVVAMVLALSLVWPIWAFVIEPWWGTRDLYEAADEARSRPYVEAAEVEFGGDLLLTDEYLVVTLTPDATAADARQLWCEVLLDVEGGWVEVSQDDDVVRPPGRRECADLAPTP